MTTAEPASRLVRRLTSPWAAAVLLALFYAALFASLRDKSATFDEPGHAAAGFVYWKFNDYRLDPENGNLPKRWFALPFLFRADQPPDLNARAWQTGNTWLLSEAWFNRSGSNTASMLASGRAAAALLAVALGALVFLWTRRIFGPLAGLLALLLYVLNPAILANGGLMTSDTAAALGFLAAVGSVWALLQQVTLARLLLGTLAIAGLFLAKMSAVLLLPVALLLVIARLAATRPLPLPGGKPLTRRRDQLIAFIAVFALQAVGVVALIWAAYGFRYSAFSGDTPGPAQFRNPWSWALGLPSPAETLDRLRLTPSQKSTADELLRMHGRHSSEWFPELVTALDRFATDHLSPDQARHWHALRSQPPASLVPRLINFARERQLLPEAFLYGYAHVWKTSDRRIAFFRGEIRDIGWRSFFPFLFAVKTPLPLLALLLVAICAALLTASGRPPLYDTLPLLALLAVYWTAALASALNIGHRHLLPIYPPLLILAGGAAARLLLQPRPAVRVAGLSLLFVHAAETAYRFPNYIAYFNGLLAPSRAYRAVVDSSLDWGQELPAIARYLDERPGEKAHLAYFGIGRPANHGIRAQHIGGSPGIDWRLLPPLHVLTDTTPAAIREFLRAHPQFDPDIVFKLEGRGDTLSALLLHRTSAHRLEPGLYVISATMLPPLYHGKVDTFWNPAHERAYQQLRQTLRPFLEGDKAAKLALTPTRPPREWLALLEDFYDLRFSRLATFLRRREPDDVINHGVLVYRLTQADLDRALDGPLP